MVFENEHVPENIDEEVIEYRGKRLRKISDPHYPTIASFYSHEGPGWDTRTILLDDERSMAVYGRTFSDSEVFSKIHELKDIPFYHIEEF